MPESTRKTLMRPANGSATVLKMNAAGPPPSTPASSGFFAGDGIPSTSRSRRPVVPRFFVGTPHATGKSSPATTAFLSAAASSSPETSPSSR